MSSLDFKLVEARKALRKKGLTIPALAEALGVEYHTALKLVTVLRQTQEIEITGYEQNVKSQVAVWKLKA
jgi:hypothetical protein